jgi:hypothetical protein
VRGWECGKEIPRQEKYTHSILLLAWLSGWPENAIKIMKRQQEAICYLKSQRGL